MSINEIENPSKTKLKQTNKQTIKKQKQNCFMSLTILCSMICG